jgi:deoxyinosine 3'endonuclease (endonuclease V)
MIIAIDVYYGEEKANAAAISFKDWKTEEIISIKSCIVDNLQPYIPGEFYKRELPCLLQVLDLYEKKEIEIIIIDGYVTLNNKGKLGLGGYLYKALGEKIPIIGVAKRAFFENTDNTISIKRGESQNPLYVTSMGMDNQRAAEKIQKMKGEFRMPHLLKLVDQESRKKDE